jgi:hypothetical protein
MDATRQNEIRCRRVGWMLEELGERVEAWMTHRRRVDIDEKGQYVGRHETQLGAVGSLLQGSLEVLGAELAAVDRGASPGEAFERSRQVADAVVWLERVWRYFGRRFDQRDGLRGGDGPDPLAATVAAADEVVWSCYRPLYEHPRVVALDLPPRPPPLPYVEPEYSPAARMTSGSLDRQLEPSAAFVALEEVAGRLPIPLLRLPPWCVGAPWWLVFVAHEVGHHLQHEMELVGPFRRAVEEAATEAGADGDDAGRWGRWGEEIFADLCSLLLMGPWALWALVEVERRPAPAMARRRPAYPPAVVRLRLMADALERLGLGPAPALRGVDLELPAGAPERLVLDAAVGDRLGPLVDRPWPRLGPLPKLLRFDAADFAAGGEVERWAMRLATDAHHDPPRHLDSARRLTAGAVAAWARLGEEAPAGELRGRARRLAERTTAAVRSASPPGTRSAFMPSGVDPAPGRRLGAELLALAAATDDEAEEDAEDGEEG